MNSGHGEDRANAGDGVARGNDDGVGRGDGVDHPRRRFRIRGAGKARGIHRVLIPALHEIFFETQLANRGVDAGFHPRVAHGKNAGLDAEFLRDDRRRFRESLALCEQP